MCCRETHSKAQMTSLAPTSSRFTPDLLKQNKLSSLKPAWNYTNKACFQNSVHIFAVGKFKIGTRCLVFRAKVIYFEWGGWVVPSPLRWNLGVAFTLWGRGWESCFYPQSPLEERKLFITHTRHNTRTKSIMVWPESCFFTEWDDTENEKVGKILNIDKLTICCHQGSSDEIWDLTNAYPFSHLVVFRLVLAIENWN